MNQIDFERLRAPFDPKRIHWRVGSTTKDKKRGLALAYIDARDVMDRLDDVVGIDGWQCRYPHANGKTCCELGVRIDGQWIWKSDGAGDTDFEGDKGAFSDAFKRAAVRFGIGRYLYDLPAEWVDIVARGNSYAISDDALSSLQAKLFRVAKVEEPRDATNDSATKPANGNGEPKPPGKPAENLALWTDIVKVAEGWNYKESDLVALCEKIKAQWADYNAIPVNVLRKMKTNVLEKDALRAELIDLCRTLGTSPSVEIKRHAEQTNSEYTNILGAGVEQLQALVDELKTAAREAAVS